MAAFHALRPAGSVRAAEAAALAAVAACVASAVALAVAGPGTGPSVGTDAVGLASRLDVAMLLVVSAVGWVVLRYSAAWDRSPAGCA